MTAICYPTPDELHACLTHPARVIETAQGPVEYAERGQGPPLLCVHGGPGGYDQGLGLGEFFQVNGFKIIAPSRPGYLGTPLTSGRTPEEQADALAALLDALNIRKIPVLGASAGGPPSYLLAARYPDKVSSLLEIDSVCLSYQPDVSPLEEKLYLSKAGIWLLRFFLDHFPEATVKSFLRTESTLDRHDIAQRAKHILKDKTRFEFLRFLIATMSERLSERQAGVDNDLTQLAAITQLPIASIACPTLIIHGTADKDVPPRHAEYAKATITGSELYWVEGGSHVGFWVADGAPAAQEYALSWLREKMKM
ncbi:MAG: alpha/beta hydrolase [Deltaproteobacteria bacterium]|nr:alpha/beta hydrolase [Deltaproteobacteria bacterium]